MPSASADDEHVEHNQMKATAAHGVDAEAGHCALLGLQGRFWQEQFESLNVPAVSKSKFQFEDGNPRVYCNSAASSSVDSLLFCSILTTQPKHGHLYTHAEHASHLEVQDAKPSFFDMQ